MLGSGGPFCLARSPKKPILKMFKGEMLYLCTKQVHFALDYEIYIQCDGVGVGSPLRPFLANIFMTYLEEEVLLTLSSCLCNWRWFEDDTHAHVILKKVLFI